MRRSYPSDGVNEMVTKEMICAAHDICLKKGDFVLSASLLERIYLAMRDKADGRDSAGWDAYEDLRKASDEMVLNLRQRVQELEKQRDELLAATEAIAINSEECLDFDECTAMLVSIDDYHKLMEAAARAKGEQ